MGESVERYDSPKLNRSRDDNVTSEYREITEEKAIQVDEEDFYGPGGTGKTLLYRALLANVRSQGMIALATATSGVATAILPRGHTTHSRFDIPLQTNETTITNMSKQSGGAKLIRKAKLIIWDEAPMARCQTIETVDSSFRYIKDIDEPFGGKVMVFGGDFRQVLPVVPKATRAETVNASLVKLYLWPKMKKNQLTRNMRARTDPILSDFLLRIGNGEEHTIKDDMILLLEQLVVKPNGNISGEDHLITEIFPSLNENRSCAKYMTK
uniref:ATP-dependent DNA helicase n=1 Tax=Nicotiana tabacum TaxID=4097 RepID=A0A1S4AU95_TOBAC|nr:PREDICTED: ATP-dependent DNA helicase PIF3-like [Nicotiana tabacum]